MNPGKADEASVWEQVNLFIQRAHSNASLEIIQAIAKHVGFETLNGLSLDEFHAKRSREIIEQLVADFADTFPTMASQMKLALEKLDRE